MSGVSMRFTCGFVTIMTHAGLVDMSHFSGSRYNMDGLVEKQEVEGEKRGRMRKRKRKRT